MKKAISVIFCFILIFTCASAHPGRTDASGGHWDRSTGEYHYHHGYPAHQHTNGICPYEYDDQTGSSSDTSSSSTTDIESTTVSPSTNTYEPAEAPEGYSDAVDYDVVAGSKLIDRTYYFDENGFMYTPFAYDDVPHGAVETDNSMYLQYDSITRNQVVYQYGLENQSEQFQEGAVFGLHEASLYYDQWYDIGYADGQQEEETSSGIEYPYDRDDGTYETAYNAGYTRGCALLIELHSDRLPDVSTLTGTLSEANRIEGSTSLEDHGATFESAYEDGYYQSGTDFYSALNDLIITGVSSDEIDEIYNAAYEQGVSDTHNYVPPAICILLIVDVIIFVYYRNKANKTRS